MKKISILVSSLIFVTMVSANAEFGIGITGAAHMLDASGTETTRESGQLNGGSHKETAIVPELFLEAIDENGYAFGISYIPTRDMGSKSRSDTNSEGDTGTYTAKAELDNVIQLYADLPMGEVMGMQTHFKIGFQHVTLAALETLNSGSDYPNKDLWGTTLGLGVKGDLPYGNNLYYKGELTYTKFEDYNAQGTGNTVSAELDDTAAKFSIGYKF